MRKVIVVVAAALLCVGLVACQGMPQPVLPITSTPASAPQSMPQSAPAAASSTPVAPPSSGAESTAGEGIVGDWEIENVGYMGSTFTLQQLERMLATTGGQLDGVLAENITTEDLQNALETFRDMRVRFDEGGTGQIYKAGAGGTAAQSGSAAQNSAQGEQQQSVSWAESAGSYEITVAGQTLPLTYNEDTLRFSYMGFELNLTRVSGS